MKSNRFLSFLLMLSCVSCNCNKVSGLKCEYATEPIGVDNPSPRFTWQYKGSLVQQSFRLVVASERNLLSAPDIYDSGLVETDFPLCEAVGANLSSFTDYWWQVTAVGEDGSVVKSAPAHFATAAMSSSDWTARWIDDGLGMDVDAAPMLRRSFTLRSKPVKAFLYQSAAAYAQTTINGKNITDAFLEPGYTDYSKRHLYGTYDVSGLLRKGENAWATVLGNGFYNEIRNIAVWDFHAAHWRGRAKYFGELHVTYSDGTCEIIATDGSWKTSVDGPFLSNNIYTGDIYDARKEIKGWDKAGFDDSSWASAAVVPENEEVLSSQIMPAIRVERQMKPVSVQSFGDTIHVFDFGYNIAGLCTFSAKGETGTKVTLEYAELTKVDGRVEMRNINTYIHPQPDFECQKDIYYMKGGCKESWTPSFTYHGFRYVEVRSDKPLKLDASSLVANYFHTAVPSVGTFESSSDIFNKIWSMTRRTYCNNFHSIITDCPTREKNGWTADSFLATELGLLNFDGKAFYDKWVDDVIDNIRPDGRVSGIIPSAGWGYADWIGPVWDASIFTIPEYIYNYYGDLSQARKLWPVWNQYLEYLKTREEEDGLPTYGIGDWVPYKAKTPTQFTTPVFYYKDYCVMARFAELLGYDPAPYREKAEKILNVINAKWFDPEKNLYANGSMAAQGVALYYGIVPEGREQDVADNLAALVWANKGYLDFGSLGSKTVLRMLTKYGHIDAAYALASKEECPSWGWWIKEGFTTLPETWALSPKFHDASIDHVFLGDVSAWYVNCLAGINCDPQIPGWKHIVLDPHFPEGLNFVKASYESPMGFIRAEWTRRGETIDYRFTVPANTTATLCGETYGPGRHAVML